MIDLLVMADKKKRSQNFTVDEKDKLVKLINVYKNIILNKKTDGTTNQAKNEAWVNLCKRFNSTGTMARSKKSLMRVWEKIKSEAKLYKSLHKHLNSGTGDCPSSVKSDPILQQVSDLMGHGCIGIAEISILDDDSIEVISETENSNSSNIVSNKIKEHVENDNISASPISPSQVSKSIPIWKRRQLISRDNDKTEVSTLFDAFTDIKAKKTVAEDLKIKILEEELKFKVELHQLQLETARKELEIKTEIYNQIKGGMVNFSNLLSIPKND